jgi:hypothetical protein
MELRETQSNLGRTAEMIEVLSIGEELLPPQSKCAKTLKRFKVHSNFLDTLIQKQAQVARVKFEI